MSESTNFEQRSDDEVHQAWALSTGILSPEEQLLVDETGLFSVRTSGAASFVYPQLTVEYALQRDLYEGSAKHDKLCLVELTTDRLTRQRTARSFILLFNGRFCMLQNEVIADLLPVLAEHQEPPQSKIEAYYAAGVLKPELGNWDTFVRLLQILRTTKTAPEASPPTKNWVRRWLLGN